MEFEVKMSSTSENLMEDLREVPSVVSTPMIEIQETVNPVLPSSSSTPLQTDQKISDESFEDIKETQTTLSPPLPSSSPLPSPSPPLFSTDQRTNLKEETTSQSDLRPVPLKEQIVSYTRVWRGIILVSQMLIWVVLSVLLSLLNPFDQYGESVPSMNLFKGRFRLNGLDMTISLWLRELLSLWSEGGDQKSKKGWLQYEEISLESVILEWKWSNSTAGGRWLRVSVHGVRMGLDIDDREYELVWNETEELVKSYTEAIFEKDNTVMESSGVLLWLWRSFGKVEFHIPDALFYVNDGAFLTEVNGMSCTIVPSEELTISNLDFHLEEVNLRSLSSISQFVSKDFPFSSLLSQISGFHLKYEKPLSHSTEVVHTIPSLQLSLKHVYLSVLPLTTQIIRPFNTFFANFAVLPISFWRSRATRDLEALLMTLDSMSTVSNLNDTELSSRNTQSEMEISSDALRWEVVCEEFSLLLSELTCISGKTFEVFRLWGFHGNGEKFTENSEVRFNFQLEDMAIEHLTALQVFNHDKTHCIESSPLVKCAMRRTISEEMEFSNSARDAITTCSLSFEVREKLNFRVVDESILNLCALVGELEFILLTLKSRQYLLHGKVGDTEILSSYGSTGGRYTGNTDRLPFHATKSALSAAMRFVSWDRLDFTIPGICFQASIQPMHVPDVFEDMNVAKETATEISARQKAGLDGEAKWRDGLLFPLLATELGAACGVAEMTLDIGEVIGNMAFENSSASPSISCQLSIADISLSVTYHPHHEPIPSSLLKPIVSNVMLLKSIQMSIPIGWLPSPTYQLRVFPSDSLHLADWIPSDWATWAHPLTSLPNTAKRMVSINSAVISPSNMDIYVLGRLIGILTIRDTSQAPHIPRVYPMELLPLDPMVWVSWDLTFSNIDLSVHLWESDLAKMKSLCVDVIRKETVRYTSESIGSVWSTSAWHFPEKLRCVSYNMEAGVIVGPSHMLFCISSSSRTSDQTGVGIRWQTSRHLAEVFRSPHSCRGLGYWMSTTALHAGDLTVDSEVSVFGRLLDLLSKLPAGCAHFSALRPLFWRHFQRPVQRTALTSHPTGLLDFRLVALKVSLRYQHLPVLSLSLQQAAYCAISYGTGSNGCFQTSLQGTGLVVSDLSEPSAVHKNILEPLDAISSSSNLAATSMMRTVSTATTAYQSMFSEGGNVGDISSVSSPPPKLDVNSSNNVSGGFLSLHYSNLSGEQPLLEVLVREIRLMYVSRSIFTLYNLWKLHLSPTIFSALEVEENSLSMKHPQLSMPSLGPGVFRICLALEAAELILPANGFASDGIVFGVPSMTVFYGTESFVGDDLDEAESETLGRHGEAYCIGPLLGGRVLSEQTTAKEYISQLISASMLSTTAVLFSQSPSPSPILWNLPRHAEKDLCFHSLEGYIPPHSAGFWQINISDAWIGSLCSPTLIGEGLTLTARCTMRLAPRSHIGLAEEFFFTCDSNIKESVVAVDAPDEERWLLHTRVETERLEWTLTQGQYWALLRMLQQNLPEEVIAVPDGYIWPTPLGVNLSDDLFTKSSTFSPPNIETNEGLEWSPQCLVSSDMAPMANLTEVRFVTGRLVGAVNEPTYYTRVVELAMRPVTDYMDENASEKWFHNTSAVLPSSIPFHSEILPLRAALYARWLHSVNTLLGNVSTLTPVSVLRGPAAVLDVYGRLMLPSSENPVSVSSTNIGTHYWSAVLHGWSQANNNAESYWKQANSGHAKAFAMRFSELRLDFGRRHHNGGNGLVVAAEELALLDENAVTSTGNVPTTVGNTVSVNTGTVNADVTTNVAAGTSGSAVGGGVSDDTGSDDGNTTSLAELNDACFVLASKQTLGRRSASTHPSTGSTRQPTDEESGSSPKFSTDTESQPTSPTSDFSLHQKHRYSKSGYQSRQHNVCFDGVKLSSKNSSGDPRYFPGYYGDSGYSQMAGFTAASKPDPSPCSDGEGISPVGNGGHGTVTGTAGLVRPHFVYEQTTVSNLRRCVVTIRDTAIVLHVATLTTVAEFFLAPHRVSGMRDTLRLAEESAIKAAKCNGQYSPSSTPVFPNGPYTPNDLASLLNSAPQLDWLTHMDVEVHLFDAVLCLPRITPDGEVNCLCFDVNASLTQAWRGLLLAGPGRDALNISMVVLSTYIAPLHEVSHNDHKAVVDSVRINFTSDLRALPTMAMKAMNEKIVRSAMRLGNWIEEANLSWGTSCERKMNLTILPNIGTSGDINHKRNSKHTSEASDNDESSDFSEDLDPLDTSQCRHSDSDAYPIESGPVGLVTRGQCSWKDIEFIFAAIHALRASVAASFFGDSLSDSQFDAQAADVTDLRGLPPLTKWYLSAFVDLRAAAVASSWDPLAAEIVASHNRRLELPADCVSTISSDIASAEDEPATTTDGLPSTTISSSRPTSLTPTPLPSLLPESKRLTANSPQILFKRRVDRKSLEANICNFAFTIGNNTYGLRLLRTDMDAIRLIYHRSPTSLEFVAQVRVALSTFHDSLGAWEPLVEPIRMTANGTTDAHRLPPAATNAIIPTAPVAVGLSSASRIQLTVHTTPLEIIASTAALSSFIRKFRLADVVTTSSQRLPPYLLVNELGVSVSVSVETLSEPIFTTDVAEDARQPIEISQLRRMTPSDNVTATSNVVAGNESGREGGSREYALRLTVVLGGRTYRSVSALSMDAVGCHPYTMVSVDEARPKWSWQNLLGPRGGDEGRLSLISGGDVDAASEVSETSTAAGSASRGEVPVIFLEMQIKADGVRELRLRSLLRFQNNTRRLFQLRLSTGNASREVSLLPGREWNVPLRWAHPRVTLSARLDERTAWVEALTSLGHLISAGHWGTPQKFRAVVTSLSDPLGSETTPRSCTVLLRPDARLARSGLASLSGGGLRGRVPVRFPTKDSPRPPTKPFGDVQTEGTVASLFSTTSTSSGGPVGGNKADGEEGTVKLKNTSVQPFSLLFQPPLQLANFLPQPLLYRITTNNSSIPLYAAGVVLPGQVIDLHTLPGLFSERIFISLRLLNYAWSKWTLLCTRAAPFSTTEKSIDIVLPPLVFHSCLSLAHDYINATEEFSQLPLELSLTQREFLVRISAAIILVNHSELPLQATMSGSGKDAVLPLPAAGSPATQLSALFGSNSTSVNGSLYGGDAMQDDNLMSSDRDTRRTLRALGNNGLDDDSGESDGEDESGSAAGWFSGNLGGFSTVPAKELLTELTIRLPWDHNQSVNLTVAKDRTLGELFTQMRHRLGYVCAAIAEYEFYLYERIVVGFSGQDISEDDLAESSGASIVETKRRLAENAAAMASAVRSSSRGNTVPDHLRFSMPVDLDRPPLAMDLPIASLTTSELVLIHRSEALISRQALTHVSSNADQTRGGNSGGLLKTFLRGQRLSWKCTHYPVSGPVPFRPPRMLGLSPLLSFRVDPSSELSEWSPPLDVVKGVFSSVFTSGSTSTSNSNTAATSNSSLSSTSSSSVPSDFCIELSTLQSDYRHNYQFGTLLERGKGLLPSSVTVVTLVVRHVLVSHLPYHLELRQIEASDILRIPVTLAARSSRTYHFRSSGKVRLLQARRGAISINSSGSNCSGGISNSDSSSADRSTEEMTNSDYGSGWTPTDCYLSSGGASPHGVSSVPAINDEALWCGEIDLTTLGIVFLRFRAPSSVVRVETELVGASLVTTFREQSLLWPPYRVVNSSSVPVRFRQLPLIGDWSSELSGNGSTAVNSTSGANSGNGNLSNPSTGHGTSPSLFWDVIGAHSSSAYSWDTPLTGTKRLQIEFPQLGGPTSAVIALDSEIKSAHVSLQRAVPNLGNPLAEGYLFVRSETHLSSLPGNSWQRLYCILRPDLMYIYADESRETLLAVLNMSVPTTAAFNLAKNTGGVANTSTGDVTMSENRTVSSSVFHVPRRFAGVSRHVERASWDGLINTWQSVLGGGKYTSTTSTSTTMDANTSRRVVLMVASLLGLFDDASAEEFLRPSIRRSSFSYDASFSTSVAPGGGCEVAADLVAAMAAGEPKTIHTSTVVDGSLTENESLDPPLRNSSFSDSGSTRPRSGSSSSVTEMERRSTQSQSRLADLLRQGVSVDQLLEAVGRQSYTLGTLVQALLGSHFFDTPTSNLPTPNSYGVGGVTGMSMAGNMSTSFGSSIGGGIASSHNRSSFLNTANISDAPAADLSVNAAVLDCLIALLSEGYITIDWEKNSQLDACYDYRQKNQQDAYLSALPPAEREIHYARQREEDAKRQAEWVKTVSGRMKHFRRSLQLFLIEYGSQFVRLTPPTLNPEMIASLADSDRASLFSSRLGSPPLIGNHPNASAPLAAEDWAFTITVPPPPGSPLNTPPSKASFRCASEMEFFGWIQAARHSVEQAWLDYFLDRRSPDTHTTTADFQHSLSLSVHGDGATRVLTITDFDPRLSAANSTTSISDISRKRRIKMTRASNLLPILTRGKQFFQNIRSGYSSSAEFDSQIDRDQQLLRVSFTVPSVGLSLIDEDPTEELLYVRLDELHMRVTRYFDAVQFLCAVKDIKIADQLLGASFPVLLTRRSADSSRVLPITSLPGGDDCEITDPALYLYFQQRYHFDPTHADGSSAHAFSGSIGDSSVPPPSVSSTGGVVGSGYRGLEGKEMLYFDTLVLSLSPLHVGIDEEIIVRLLRCGRALHRVIKPPSAATKKKVTAATLDDAELSAEHCLLVLPTRAHPLIAEHHHAFLTSGIRPYHLFTTQQNKGSLSLYFGQLHLRPLDLTTHFRTSPEVQLSGSELALVSVASQLDGLRLSLNALLAEHAYGSSALMLEVIRKHYRAAFWRQFQRLMGGGGGSDNIDEAVGLVANLGGGVFDVVLESLDNGSMPTSGAENGNFDAAASGGQISSNVGISSSSLLFQNINPSATSAAGNSLNYNSTLLATSNNLPGTGIQTNSKNLSLASRAIGNTSSIASKISGGIGKGMSLLTLDADFNRARAYRRFNKASSVGEGLLVGTQELGKTIVEGFAGIVVSPYRGWEQGGSVGAAVGVAKGLLGVALKPAVGVMDLASRATEGIRSATLSAEAQKAVQPLLNHANRSRPPRVFGPSGLVMRYDFARAYVQHLVDSLHGFRADLRIPWTHYMRIERFVPSFAADPNRQFPSYNTTNSSGHSSPVGSRQVPPSSTGAVDDWLTLPNDERWGIQHGAKFLALVCTDRITLLEVLPGAYDFFGEVVTPETKSSSLTVSGSTLERRLHACRFIWTCPASALHNCQSDSRGDILLTVQQPIAITGSVTANAAPLILDRRLQNYIIFQTLLEQLLGPTLARMHPLYPARGLTANNVRKRYVSGIRSFLLAPSTHIYRLYGNVLYEYSRLPKGKKQPTTAPGTGTNANQSTTVTNHGGSIASVGGESSLASDNSDSRNPDDSLRGSGMVRRESLESISSSLAAPSGEDWQNSLYADSDEESSRLATNEDLVSTPRSLHRSGHLQSATPIVEEPQISNVNDHELDGHFLSFIYPLAGMYLRGPYLEENSTGHWTISLARVSDKKMRALRREEPDDLFSEYLKNGLTLIFDSRAKAQEWRIAIESRILNQAIESSPGHRHEDTPISNILVLPTAGCDTRQTEETKILIAAVCRRYT